MAPGRTEADAAFNRLMKIGSETNVIESEPLKLENPTITTLKASKTIWHKIDVKHTECVVQGSLNEAARLLDIFLAIATATGLEKFVSKYFDYLESTVGMLTGERLQTFWPYFEYRTEQISKLAQGSSSIALLRICRSIILRLNTELYSEQIGRVIQYLAITKGFPHPSRLNKRGKKRPVKFEHPLPSSLSDSSSSNEITPFKASELLSDLNTFEAKNELLTFVGTLVNSLKSALSKRKNTSGSNASRTVPPAAVLVITPEISWQQLSDECSELLLSQALIAFATYSSENNDLKNVATEAFEKVRGFIEKWDLHTMEQRLIPSEEKWTQWKEQRQCAHIDVVPVFPLGENHTALTPNKETLPSIEGLIGNSELTQQVNVPFNLETFAVKVNCKDYISDLQEARRNASDKQEQDSVVFKISRSTEWGQLASDYESTEVAGYPELAEQEERVQKELRDASAPGPPVKRAQPQPLENPSKRARLSYEDTRYTERAAVEGTARPLPY